MIAAYRNCLVCGEDFPPNDALERLGRGRRFAYDPRRGRLWMVCGSCQRWSLIPVEERWEALEELERVAADGRRTRVLARTDNVALLRVGRVDLVRVGRADLEEEAWWRYGRKFEERRRRRRRLAVAALAGGAGLLMGWALAGGASFVAAWLLWDRAPPLAAAGARRLRFGRIAWEGPGSCARCGLPVGALRYRDRDGVILTGEGEAPGVAARCRRCGDAPGAGHSLGADGDAVLRRMLAYHNFAGASPARVCEAVALIDFAGGAGGLPKRVLGAGASLGALDPAARVALEIAVNEERERALLEMEMEEIEARWRREEELAGIVDGELAAGALGTGSRPR